MTNKAEGERTRDIGAPHLEEVDVNVGLLILRQIIEMQRYDPPIEGRSRPGLLRLDFNEWLDPPIPQVKEVLTQFADHGQFATYPEYGDLLEAISGYAGVKSKEVLPTNGSDRGIEIIYQAVLDRGDKVIIPVATFAMLKLSAEARGAGFITPSYKGESLEFPFEEVMDGIRPGIKMVVICNPNNPTGSSVSREQTEEIIRKAADVGAAILVDEAYHEFAPELTVANIIPKYNNLFITRSLSKSMGTASLRTGYVLSQERNIEQIKKIPPPYDVSKPAALVMGTLKDEAVRQTMKEYARAVMEDTKPQVERFYKEHDIKYFPSSAPFHLIVPPAPGLTEFLEERGILVRPRSDPPGSIRVSLGRIQHMRPFMSAVQDFIQTLD